MRRKVIALRALDSASAFLKKKFRVVRQGMVKPDGSLVSEADHGSEERIIRVLRASFPDDAVISEECGEIAGTSGYRWILDPLDGTHNFLGNIPLFGILLALERKGVVLFSFCVFPVLGEVFFAERGKGAYLNGKRIRVSPVRSIEGALFFGDGNRKLKSRVITRSIEVFHAQGCRPRLLGEGPFGMTRVALGSAGFSLMHLGKVWDIAAPSLLVEEAGGMVTDFQGNMWTLKECPLLATNGLLHAAVLSLTAGKPS